MWGDVRPPTWTKVLQGSVVRLRKVLGAEAIETSPAGYRLTTPTGRDRRCRFERLARRSSELLAWVSTTVPPTWAARRWRCGGAPRCASSTAGTRVGSRPGGSTSCAWTPRRSAWRRRCVRVATGRCWPRPRPGCRGAAAERRWALLALAQYQVGRQGDALRTLHKARRAGRGAGPRSRADAGRLEQAILQQDPSLVARRRCPSRAPVCPYLGLVPYDVADAETFFGRDAELSECLRAARRRWACWWWSARRGAGSRRWCARASPPRWSATGAESS